jgi:hypothetical protein
MDLKARRRKSNLLIFAGAVIVVLSTCQIFSVPVFFPETTCGALGGLLDCDGTLECTTSSRSSGGRNYMNLRATCDGEIVSAAPIFFVTGGVGCCGLLVFALAMVVAITIRPKRADYAAELGVHVIDLRRR